ncbi:addiction module antidote protein [Thiomicrospira sp.]|uniref:addiction module antidote protein n=1 Tax=Thiomicrospira sp. TaxID=935 RepID=UPI002F935888
MKLTEFNPLDDLLTTPQEVADYLNDAYHDEDPAVFVVALGHVAKKHGMSKISELTGLSRESLYKAFNGKVQPKWDTIFKVMRALNIDLKVAA